MGSRTVPRTHALVASLLIAAAEAPLRGAEYRIDPLAAIDPDIPAYGNLDGLVIFDAHDGNSTGLYSTDGTFVRELSIAGLEDPRPELVYQWLDGFGRPKLEPFRGAVYFVADGPGQRTLFNRTLYKTDGHAVTEVARGVSGIRDYDVYLPPLAFPTDHYLYFRPNFLGGSSLHKTDGVSVMSAEIASPESIHTSLFARFEGDAILQAHGPGGATFYREGAGGLTEIVFDEPISQPGLSTEVGGNLFFTAHDDRFPSLRGGRRLFRTDGASIRELELPDIAQRIDSFAVAGDRLYFKADVPVGNQPLRFERVWHTDGNTVEMLDLEREDQHATRFIGNIGNDAYFFEGAERRIIRTDGDSIFEVDVDLRPDVINFSHKGRLGDALLVELEVADTGVPSSTTSGLFLLSDDAATYVDIGHGSYGPLNVTLLGEDVFFTAVAELFKLSGVEVTEFDINPDGISYPQFFSVINDALYFTAKGPMGRELYATDGDSLTLIDINRNGDSNPRILEHVNGNLLVVADAGGGEELFSITRAARSGDFDGNGLVEQTDLDLVLSHWGETEVPAGWVRDLPTGVIDQEELDRVLAGWGSRILGTPAAVPEPHTAALVLATVLVAIGRLMSTS